MSLWKIGLVALAVLLGGTAAAVYEHASSRDCGPDCPCDGDCPCDR